MRAAPAAEAPAQQDGANDRLGDDGQRRHARESIATHADGAARGRALPR